jgi:hypothetical protein
VVEWSGPFAHCHYLTRKWRPEAQPAVTLSNVLYVKKDHARRGRKKNGAIKGWHVQLDLEGIISEKGQTAVMRKSAAETTLD